MSKNDSRRISGVVDRAGRRISVVYRPPSEAKLGSRNPRDHTRGHVNQIARSIESFDFITPVVVDADGNVVAGHGRVLAALKLGLAEIPMISVEHLSKAQLKAFQMADNKLAENSSWNDRLLAEQLKFLADSELEFELEVTGFTTAEIDLRIEGLKEEEPGDSDPADALPAQGSTISRPGDQWVLGKNRVACANALDEHSYATLMQGEKASMAFIDMPYNVPIEGNVSGLGTIRHQDFAMGCGEMNVAQFTAFQTQVFVLLNRFSHEGALHFICMDWRHLSETLNAGEQASFELKNICVWVKNHTGMGALYRSRHEFVLVYKHGKAHHRNNILLGKYGRDRTNVWTYPSPRTPSEEGNLLSFHPTVKPVRMVADAILDCTARGESVMDSFLGSGTSLIAAERTGRRCFGLEIDPRYVDTAVRRWQAYTGEQARHAATGRGFNELEAEMEGRDGR